MHLAQQLLMNVQWSDGSMFCKGDKNFEDEECSGQPLEVDNNQLRAIIEADPLKTTWRIQCPPFYSHWAFEANWKGEKSSVSGCLICWPQIKKVIILKGHLLFYTTVNKFSIGLWCVMKSGLYTTTSDDQLDQEETTKHFLKAKLAPKKRKKKFMVTVWWSAARLIHYHIWEVCSANQ